MEINNIYNGDCLDLLKELLDESVDMILTDPPYGINYFSNHNKIKKRLIANDKLEDWMESLPEWLTEFKRIIKPQGVVACCCGGGGKTPVTAWFTVEAIKHFNLIQTLVWKKYIGLGWKYRPAYENILILSKDKDNYNFYDESNACANVIEGINQDIPEAHEHPTLKPVKLMSHLLQIHTKPGDLVVDPFMGTGTTCVAAQALGRKYIGIDIDPTYFEAAKKRLSQMYFAFE